MNNSIDNLLQYYSSTERYQAKQNQIPNDAIAFVEDEGVIYTHGHKFGGSADIENGSVTTSKIAQKAVTSSKLADNIQIESLQAENITIQNDDEEIILISGGTEPITSKYGFKKEGKTNADVLLAGGGTKPLSEIGGGGVDQIQSDWNQTNENAKDYIKNKPTIPQVPEIDYEPTPNSDNLVTSGGVYNAINSIESIESGSITDTSTYERTTYSEVTYYWCTDKVFELNTGDSVIVTPRHVLASQTVWASDPIALIPVETGSYKYTAAADNVRITVGFTSADEFDYVITRKNSILDYVSRSTVSCVERQTLDFEEQTMARENIGIQDEVIDAGEDSKKVYLKRNIVEIEGEEKNILTQDAFYKDNDVAASRSIDNQEDANERVPNTDKIFVVKYDFDLNEDTITIPDNSILEFDGGSINNGKLTGNVKIINCPDNLYETVECNNLFVENEKHLNNTDVLQLYDNAGNDAVVIPTYNDQILSSSNFYSVGGINKLICRVQKNILGTASPSLRYIFYDKNFAYVGKSDWKSLSTTVVEDVPSGVAYVVFNISGKNLGNRSIDAIIDRAYLNILNQEAVSIKDKLMNELPDTLTVDLGNISGGHIISDGNGNYIYNKNGRIENEEQVGSIFIPYDVFKYYDYIEFVGEKTRPNCYVDFLKKIPREPNEVVEYSDWYNGRISIYNSRGVECDYAIPKDCKCIYVRNAVNVGGVITKCVPKQIVLKKLSSNGLDTVDINTKTKSEKDVNLSEIKFLHWNTGQNNLGQWETGHNYFNNSNIQSHIDGFKQFFNSVAGHHLLFNEYFSVIGTGTNKQQNFENVLPARYGMTGRIAFAEFSLCGVYYNQLVATKLGWCDCLKGIVGSNNLPQYSCPYIIYRYVLGNVDLYVVSVHVPALITKEIRDLVLTELKTVTSSYSNVVIVGDFNDSGTYSYNNPTGDKFVNVKEIFKEENGWHIANEEHDDTPTFDYSKSYGKVTTLLDYVVWRGDDIDVPYLKVRTDAIVPGTEELSETEGRIIDDDPQSGDTNFNESYVNHRLSDHWPVEFTVIQKNKQNVTPSVEGANRYDRNSKAPQWYNGEDWVSSNGERTDIRKSGTTEQRPGTEQNTKYPKTVGFTYYDESLNKVLIWNGFSWLYETPSILSIGDSILRGYRNEEKSFFKYITNDFKQDAISGSRLSYKSGYSIKTAYEQLEDEVNYDPEVIITGSGVNDWALDAPLGTMPTVAVTNDTEANALDKTKVYDAVQYTFYQMIKKYPKARRFFITTTRFDCDVNEDIQGKYTDTNTQNYSYKDLAEGIKQICELYGVIFIDILNKSFVSSEFSIYKAPTKYSEVPVGERRSWNRKYYIDADGLHPTDLCYKEVYAEIIGKELNDYVNKKLIFITSENENFVDSNNNNIII